MKKPPPSSLLATARQLYSAGNLAQALGVLSHLVSYGTRNDAALCLYADILHDQDRFDQAVHFYRWALETNPRNLRALCALGIVLKAQNKMGEARELFQRMTKFDYNNVNALYQRSEMETLTATSKDFLHLKSIVDAANNPTPYYALGKAYDDQGKYDDAWDCYRRGARIQRGRVRHNEKVVLRQFDEVRETYGADFFAQLDKRQYGPRAVFIVGMPRCGSTLLEQILSSHPAVAGIGESALLHTVLSRLRIRNPTLPPWPAYGTKLSAAERKAGGDWYWHQIRSAEPHALRVVNKMLNNFFNIGLIAALLPDAKVIYAARNPMDVCLSNFTRLYRQDMGHTYNLMEMGRYYVKFHQLMEHWRAVVPANMLYVSQYETTVADLEGEARRVLEFLDLPWDSAVLDFKNNRKPVKTSSIMQVRRDIYTTSAARWRKYSKHLDPLRKILDSAGVPYN